MTRADIESIRGVSVSSQIMRQLEERGWIEIVGYKEVVGKPALWATTNSFLADLGLQNLSELPVLNSKGQFFSDQFTAAFNPERSEEVETINTESELN